MEDKRETSNQSSTNPQRVSRRSIIRSGSEIRHGRVYDHQAEPAQRVVTPDIDKSTTSEASVQDDIQASPLSSQFPRTQAFTPSKETSASTFVTEDDSVLDNRRHPSQRRRPVRDDLPADASPSSLFNRTRKRLGSITNNAQMTNQQEAGHGSIGYPSVGNATALPNVAENVQMRPPGTPRRTVSSDAAVGLTASPPLFLDTDASKILQLMKTTYGRMHGILFFRSIGTSMWDSGYCAINVAPGSLVCQKQGELATARILVPDLRGCTVRTHYDSETQSVFISIVLPQSGFGVQLRPPVPETFDSWLAALLCWQPLEREGLHNKAAKIHSVNMADRRPVSSSKISDFSISKSNAIVKVGRMVTLEGPLPAGSQRHISRRNADFDTLQPQGPWRRVSCTLHENGTFKLLTDGDAKPICVVRLSQLTRCAVQRLDESILDAPYCLAIYPQYTIQNSISRRSQPLVLGLESKPAYEAWFVLLRALTVPELYGLDQRRAGISEVSSSTKSSNPASLFRIERSLGVKITEAKFDQGRLSEFAFGTQSAKSRPAQINANEIDVYADIIFGRDLMARTATKTGSTSVFWADEFFLPDIPSMLSSATINMKVGNPAEREWTAIAHHKYDLSSGDPNSLTGMNGLEIASHDPDFGGVEIMVEDLDGEKVVEKWWPLLDKNGQQTGQLLMKVNLLESVVLTEKDYQPLSKLLHTFENSLTTQIGHVLGLELKALSEILLDIFQASGSAQEWIGALIDEEIDGIYKETPPVRMRFSGRIHSNDSYESAEHREQLVRDLSKSATMEANLLFRGNSLVTKALDAHMRRLGRNYLENTLGDKLRQIAFSGPDCEVDPIKIQSRDQIEKNWATLINLTKSVWSLIYNSASKCPTELRLIFKHIRSCAEDRYGSFIRTVKYTSVSGFLFLRFFCPAILNPKLFGLIDEFPNERARRTFTLIAKALNVLASMSKFGTKEPWMERMNKFVVTATPDFKKFIEEVCSVSLSQPVDFEPQYLAPTQIRARLSPMSREGLATLPFLLDSSRSLASLIDLWVSSAPETLPDAEIGGSIRVFHQLCFDLYRKGKDSIARAEPVEKPEGSFEPQWQRLLSERQKPKRSVSGSRVDESLSGFSLDQDITALPQRGDSRKVSIYHKSESYEHNNGGDTTPSSSASANEQRNPQYQPPYAGLNPVLTSSTNSSTLSFDISDDTRPRPQSSSRDGASKARYLEPMNPNTRKRTKGGSELRRPSREEERNVF